MDTEENTSLHCDSAARFRLTSRSSAIVSLVPLPLGSETHGLVPSPMTKMLVILNTQHVIQSAIVSTRECHSPCRKSTIQCIFYMYNVKVTDVLLAVYDNTGTTHVTTTRDYDLVSRIKFGNAGDLVLGEVKLDGVVYLDYGVGITNRASIVSDNVGDPPVAKSDFLHLEELVHCFLSGDPVDNKAALDIIKQAKVLARLLNGEHIYQEIRSLNGTS